MPSKFFEEDEKVHLAMSQSKTIAKIEDDDEYKALKPIVKTAIMTLVNFLASKEDMESEYLKLRKAVVGTRTVKEGKTSNVFDIKEEHFELAIEFLYYFDLLGAEEFTYNKSTRLKILCTLEEFNASTCFTHLDTELKRTMDLIVGILVGADESGATIEQILKLELGFKFVTTEKLKKAIRILSTTDPPFIKIIE